MSAPRRDALLTDLVELADEVAGYVEAWGERGFLADRAKQRAIERDLELLGEVATRLGDDAPGDGVDWQALRDLRVLLAHAYHRIDARRLWVYAVRDVPRVRDAAAAARGTGPRRRA